MRESPSVEEAIREVVENTRAEAWAKLEPSDPPTFLSLWLEDIENYSGRVPVHGPIVIRERKSTDESPFLDLDRWACMTLVTLMCGSDPGNAESDINLAQFMDQEGTDESP